MYLNTNQLCLQRYASAAICVCSNMRLQRYASADMHVCSSVPHSLLAMLVLLTLWRPEHDAQYQRYCIIMRCTLLSHDMCSSEEFTAYHDVM